MIFMIFDNFRLEVSYKRLDLIKELITRQLMKVFKVQEEADIKANFYGMTGAGIQFINSSIKIQVRMKNVVERCL